MKILKCLKDIWNFLDYILDCPECRGTGEPYTNTWNYEYVWWKGKQILVCDRCHGSGKI